MNYAYATLSLTHSLYLPSLRSLYLCSRCCCCCCSPSTLVVVACHGVYFGFHFCCFSFFSFRLAFSCLTVFLPARVQPSLSFSVSQYLFRQQLRYFSVPSKHTHTLSHAHIQHKQQQQSEKKQLEMEKQTTILLHFRTFLLHFYKGSWATPHTHTHKLTHTVIHAETSLLLLLLVVLMYVF